ncbi:unnamed protein product [Hyaloperonospora brassicae]|uniref:PH domain-containing protein n=1 Tax=Hyaloperonospora brassicae TaxID=162125 RepID=A0AAV0V2K0_HYABA|nr:unnamed protein product [Hyaloperonospora brassicae]
MHELLYSGRLLALTTDDAQVQHEAVSFLQRLVEPVLVVSIHGPAHSGKTSLVRRLFDLHDDDTATEGVWLYVTRVNFQNATYLAIVDRPGFRESPLDRLLYLIFASLSSAVVHHVDGHLSATTLDQFAIFGAKQGQSDAPLPSDYDFPQSPKLLWVLQNVSTSELKQHVQESGLSLQETEEAYLCNALAALPEDSPGVGFVRLLGKVFPDQGCFAVPPRESEAFQKRVEKLSRVFTQSVHNRYLDSIVLNGPLIGVLMASMLARRDNISTVFRGQVWKDTIFSCCHNVVENGVKLYKFWMSERLGSIVDIADVEPLQSTLASSPEKPAVVELPCEHQVLLDAHDVAKRKAKATLRTIPVQSEKQKVLFKKLFRDSVESVLGTIWDENDRISSEVCQATLAALHTTMSEQIDLRFALSPQNDRDSYSCQSADFKRFYHRYQANLFKLMIEYTDQAKGPVKKQELAKFMHNVIRPQLAELSDTLEKVRRHDVDEVQADIATKEQEIKELNNQQRLYQELTTDTQKDVNRQLVEGAELHALRKEALVQAINDLTKMHAMATEQKDLLEEAAFVSVQLPEQKVIEAAQDKKEEVTELQGYLIKQGGGGNVLNLLGRKNWKRRYFILIGANLIYAKTKDDYERGKVIKELSLTGCRIDPSRDAGEGLDITPGKAAHVFALQRGLFEKNSKKRSSAADTGRIFKLRAQNIQERDIWIDKLRQAAGGY